MTVKIGKEFDDALHAYGCELFANESASRMDAKLEKVRELIAALQAERNQALRDAESAREERNRVGVEIRREMLASAGVFGEIVEERQRQDAQWGGPAHDDEHQPIDFMRYIGDQRRKAAVACGPVHRVFRARFVKIAALAIAAIESIDRKAGKE